LNRNFQEAHNVFAVISENHEKKEEYSLPHHKGEQQFDAVYSVYKATHHIVQLFPASQDVGDG
jgi:hypothetical protein